jgi:hypothetical protein
MHWARIPEVQSRRYATPLIHSLERGERLVLGNLNYYLKACPTTGHNVVMCLLSIHTEVTSCLSDAQCGNAA